MSKKSMMPPSPNVLWLAQRERDRASVAEKNARHWRAIAESYRASGTGDALETADEYEELAQFDDRMAAGHREKLAEYEAILAGQGAPVDKARVPLPSMRPAKRLPRDSRDGIAKRFAEQMRGVEREFLALPQAEREARVQAAREQVSLADVVVLTVARREGLLDA